MHTSGVIDDSAIHMTTVALMQALRRYFKLYHTFLIFRVGLGHCGSHARLGRVVLQEHRSPVLRALAVTSRDALSCSTSLHPFRLMWHLAWLWSIDFQILFYLIRLVVIGLVNPILSRCFFVRTVYQEHRSPLLRAIAVASRGAIPCCHRRV